jgi:C4-dicarboxylate-specific signal transduction histidine kinase
VACAIRDITERKRTEELLSQRQEELAHVVRLSTAGEMATGLAHELNQPLYSIANYARGCIHRLNTSSMDSNEFQEVAEEIAAEAERAAEIVRRLRQMVQKRQPVRSAIGVNQTIDEACALCRFELHRANVCREEELDPSLPYVLGDEIQLQQVLVNLLRNAVAAMRDTPQGERVLRVVTGQHDPTSVRVSVADTGCGIPEKDLERIFDAFYTTSSSGMGMGLAISRSIIESHGGRIWATNNARRGATFHFTLPVPAEEGHDRSTDGVSR